MKHVNQNIVKDEHGTLRFQENKIVSFLLERGGFDLNDLACMDFSKEDRIQFAQLIGYSVSGWGTLSYVDNDSYYTVAEIQNGESDKDAKIKYYENLIEQVRNSTRSMATSLFNIHEDDLT